MDELSSSRKDSTAAQTNDPKSDQPKNALYNKHVYRNELFSKMEHKGTKSSVTIKLEALPYNRWHLN